MSRSSGSSQELHDSRTPSACSPQRRARASASPDSDTRPSRRASTSPDSDTRPSRRARSAALLGSQQDDAEENSADAMVSYYMHLRGQPFASRPPSTSNEQPFLPHCITRDAATVPQHLRNDGEGVRYSLGGPVIRDERMLLTPLDDTVGTMDSVHKCFSLLASDDPSRLVQTFDGTTWAFMARCIGDTIPRHVTDVLYFFHMLKMFAEVNTLTGFVMPSPSVRVVHDHKKPHGIVRIMAMRCVFPSRESPIEGGPPISMIENSCMGTPGEQEFADVRPFSVRVGFTGAFLSDEGEASSQPRARTELFCVVFVTPLRSFNLTGYITERFLAPPRSGSFDFKNKFAEWHSVKGTWERILHHEMFENMRLPEHSTLPIDFMNDVGGRLEADKLLSPLNLPHRIARVLHTMHPRAADVRVIGFPNLSSEYAEYHLASLDHVMASRVKLTESLREYNTAKPELRELVEAKVPCPGGFPLHEDEQGVYTAFGLPPLPILMNWDLKFTDFNLTIDTFRLNMGKLPRLVSVHLRRFLTFDPSAPDFTDVDLVMLTDRASATPSAILERYYGPGSNPLEGLSTAGCLQDGWLAIRQHIAQMREAGRATPEVAGSMLARYLRNCMETHRGMIYSGVYPSLRVQQALQILEKCKSTPLWRANMHERVAEAAPRIHASIRHDPYLRASCVFLSAFADLNKDFVLNAGNLECVLEMMVSSLAWLMGAHNESFKWFFQVLTCFVLTAWPV